MCFNMCKAQFIVGSNGHGPYALHPMLSLLFGPITSNNEIKVDLDLESSLFTTGH